ncbi:hypothetical protein SCAR479_03665 [Seiridium cardinale]|uniref:Uncharacterized protein n=1 Tax=Seiridium cardinale TaxID=138064 RepID=A0ABR2Y0L7_9PEZI
MVFTNTDDQPSTHRGVHYIGVMESTTFTGEKCNEMGFFNAPSEHRAPEQNSEHHVYTSDDQDQTMDGFKTDGHESTPVRNSLPQSDGAVHYGLKADYDNQNMVAETTTISLSPRFPTLRRLFLLLPNQRPFPLSMRSGTSAQKHECSAETRSSGADEGRADGSSRSSGGSSNCNLGKGGKYLGRLVFKTALSDGGNVTSFMPPGTSEVVISD